MTGMFSITLYSLPTYVNYSDYSCSGWKDAMHINTGDYGCFVIFCDNETQSNNSANHKRTKKAFLRGIIRKSVRMYSTRKVTFGSL